jgi:chemotaxis signal transduction protein
MGEAVLIARVAGERFAVPAVRVQSVVELGEVVPVPRAPDYIAGLTTLRSRSLTVIDTTRALELSSTGGSRHLALVVEADGCGFALAVDSVETVVDCEGEPEPLTMQLSPGWMRCAQGKVETPAGVVLMINLDRLIAGPEMEKAA